MRMIARRDRAQRLAFVDIAEPDFDADRYGATHEAMMAQLHAVDDKGQLLIGVDCVAAIYTAVGRGWLVWPLKITLTKPIWRYLYRLFARNRYRTSKLLGLGCDGGTCDLRYR
jgi:predicted DCC family thiol-disulfide oxidoreductase YuxK